MMGDMHRVLWWHVFVSTKNPLSKLMKNTGVYVITKSTRDLTLFNQQTASEFTADVGSSLSRDIF
jgi:hypothetical protein